MTLELRSRESATALSALLFACTALLMILPAAPARAQIPSPESPVWGAYRSGLGYPVSSAALQERAAKEGIDPRCLMTTTVAWQSHPLIVTNVENGLMQVLIEGVTWQRATAVARSESPYFNSEINCTSSHLSGVWSTTFGNINFGSGGGRATYEDGKSRILFRLNGRVLEGNWVEPHSVQKCSSAVDGSYYWGTVRFEFNSSFTSFDGSYTYCGQGTARNWDGRKGTGR